MRKLKTQNSRLQCLRQSPGGQAKLKTIFLLAILVLAAFLRLWQLDDYPAGLNADEAAIGYNAYSLIQTGKDEHGNSWPIHFKSFGDYKPGFYFYLVLPFVKVLGLNIWAVRLPSAFLAILSVWLIYLLVKELFRDEFFALISAFFLTISPWHLHFSRGGWEVNAGTFFIFAGVYLFLRAVNKPNLFPFSILSFAFSLYTYHSARVIVPLLGLGLLLFYRQKIFKKEAKKWFLIAVILGAILAIPLAIDFFSPAGVSRFSGVGLLADTGPLWRVNELRSHHPRTMSLNVRLLHNRLVGYGMAFLDNYFDHFWGEFLFLSGDEIPRSRVPETGQLYLFEIPLIALGVYFFLRKKPENWQLIFIWLAIAPVAAAMTFQTPHALRAHNMVIPLAIISAYGFGNVLQWLKNQKKMIVLAAYVVIIFFISWNFARYLHQYYVHYPKTYPFAWEDGFEELVTYVSQVEDKYEKIYVTDRYDQPYIIFLFYLQYPPEKFQQEVKLTPRDRFGFSTVRHFDKFYFGGIDYDTIKLEENVLIIGCDEEIPDSIKIIKEVYFQNGQRAFQITES